MAIENRNLTPGTMLAARYHKLPFTCEVVAGENAKLRYRLPDGKEYNSPSAAGMAITGKACNGWAFWSLKTDEAAPAPQTAGTATPEVAASAPEPPAATVSSEPALPLVYRIYKTPNQKGVPEGQRRWTCDGCGKSFVGCIDKPDACPQGHQAA